MNFHVFKRFGCTASVVAGLVFAMSVTKAAPRPGDATGPQDIGLMHADRAAHGQHKVSVLVEGVAQDRLFAVAFDGGRGAAVGEAGTVHLSHDGGDSWMVEQAPTQLALFGVALSNGEVLAVGQEGLVLLRDESGVWQEADSGTRERLLEVAAGPNGLAVAVGAFGTVIVSTDGGRHWREAAPDWRTAASIAGVRDRTGAIDEPTMFAAQVLDSGTLLIGGELAYILRSDDGAQSWELVNHVPNVEGGVPPALHNIDVRPDGVGFAVGQEGQVFKTTNAGLSWSPRQTPVHDGNLLAVSSTGDGAVVAVGMRVAVRSEDDGETWFVAQGGDFLTAWYSDVIRVAGQARLISVGHSGRIIAIQ